MNCKEEKIYEKPEKIIELNGQIIGLAISPKQDMLYVNVRSWILEENEKFPIEPTTVIGISDKIEMKLIDLHTFQLLETSIVGHMGYTPPGAAFYLYLSVSPNLGTN